MPLYKGFFSSIFSLINGNEITLNKDFTDSVTKSVKNAQVRLDKMQEEYDMLNMALKQEIPNNRKDFMSANSLVAKCYKEAYNATKVCADEMSANREKIIQDTQAKIYKNINTGSAWSTDLKPKEVEEELNKIHLKQGHNKRYDDLKKKKNKTDEEKAEFKDMKKRSLTSFEKSLLKKEAKYLKEVTPLLKKFDREHAGVMGQLGNQMQTMAFHRGYIAATTQNLLESDAFKNNTHKTFQQCMEDTKMLSLEAATSGAKGATNELYKAKVNINNLEEKEYFVKPGEMVSTPDKREKKRINSNEPSGYEKQLKHLGIYDEAKKDSVNTNETAFRDQGAQMVAKMMGLEGSIVKSRLAMDDKTGYVSVMDSAPGYSALTVATGMDENDVQAYKDNINYVKESCEKNNKVFTPVINYNCGTVRLMESPFVADLSNPSLQEEAINMQALDFVCGQYDRHSGNFFISKETDKNGVDKYRLTGIDNDGAFSSSNYENSVYSEDFLKKTLPFVTPDLKKKILDMDKGEVCDSLRGLVDRGEKGENAIRDTGRRIDILQSYVKDCPVVKPEELNKETADELLKCIDNPYTQLKNNLQYGNASKALYERDFNKLPEKSPAKQQQNTKSLKQNPPTVQKKPSSIRKIS
ncbi:MAG: hypothetical protein FWE90_08125 [Defluviitaleaceae bacterium]|nr:hypothetical protein [Defluviitaleaceae bacterium]